MLRDLVIKDIVELTDSHSNIINTAIINATNHASSNGNGTNNTNSNTSSGVIVTRVHTAKLLEAYPEAAIALPSAMKRPATSTPLLSSSLGEDNHKRARMDTPKLEPIALSDDKTVKLERLTSPTNGDHTTNNDATSTGTATTPTTPGSVSVVPAVLPTASSLIAKEQSPLTNSTTAASVGGDDTLKSLLGTQSFKDRAFTLLGQEILDLVTKPSAQDLIIASKFKTTGGGSAVILHCPHGTKDACCHERRQPKPCDKVHWIQV